MEDVKRTVRSALVIGGAGSIGMRHASNLKELGIAVSIFDIDKYAVDWVCRKEGYTRCENLDRALCEDQIDLALVCTPTHLHVPFSQKVADAGINLFIEKPISHTRDGVQDLINTVKKNNVCATVGFMLRYETGLNYLKSVVDPNEIAFAQVEGGSYLPDWRPGRDYRKTYSANKSMGGGAILDGVHEIDYICWLLGYPEQIVGVSGKYSSMEIDTEDTAMMLLKYNNSLASIHLDYLQRKYTRRCKLCKRNGDVYEWTFGQGVKEITSKGERYVCSLLDFKVNSLYTRELVNFISCIQNRKQPESTLQNSLELLDIILAAKSGEVRVRDYSNYSG